jgi:lipopolysaccharide/colanic/teichoic acid biosynthesis glycosyltransferase
MLTAQSGVFPPLPSSRAVASRHGVGWALLPLFDAASMALAGLLSFALLWTLYLPGLSAEALRLVWIAAMLAPFLLDDRGADRRDAVRGLRRLGGRLLRRGTLLALVMAVLMYAGGWWVHAPATWLLLWSASALIVTLCVRLALLRLATPPTATGTGPEEAEALWIAESIPVSLIMDRPIRRWSAVLKGAKDRVLAMVLVLLLSPLLVAIAVAIRCDSPGPLLFRQRRHGLNNAEFDIFKFRTMRVAVGQSPQPLQQTLRGDVRITRVGGFLRKWSLDELPQLINVLNGSMSLVGPRPHAVDMRTEARLGEEITLEYPHRHRVRPGITGWSQVNGARGATDTVEQLQRRVTLDLYYIEHWSLLLDVKILALTSRAVIRATNAF